MSIDLYIIRIKKAGRILRSPRLLLAFFRYGVFAGVEHYSVLKPGFKTIVDIGANKGQFALACRERIPHARIISFEPLKAPAKKFKTLFRNDASVCLKEVAIGPKTIRSVMHVSAHEDSSSLLPIGPNQIEFYPGTQEKNIIEVDVAPLTSYLMPEDINSPAMLKLDVQGFEMEALKGCEALIEKFDFIYCECSFIELYSGQKLAYEIIEWLHHHKFNLIGIFNSNYDLSGQAIQADFLFKQKFI
ncbi:FkbM family methyltransferase [Polynucleobacter sp. HIN5]|uniref:FkbM family methyltransferase n=1 Tax=Polynucleobacter sp. HIN5 TaxID=3047864 RepID=UPI0025747D07|nr:FkbM family methyltransferase [Polynucleobacter sp. HIN5]BEI32959.1 [alpha-L-fucopyranosyl-(1->3)-alpha-L-rhamnopyran osyl-(1->3)-2-O-methyl-alpha-L-rhamnopyranosyl] dimycocerosyl phenol-phthiocerol 2'''-O-methyltransferase [Polynucleobacter sp. HIN5]